MLEKQSTFFSSDIVGQAIYINLERSPDRRIRVEEMAERIGLDNLQHVPGIDGTALEGGQRKHAVRNTKVTKTYANGQWADTDDTDYALKELLEKKINIPTDVSKLALGKYGCQAGHINAMQHALGHIAPGDEDKWIIIMEDDVVLRAEDRDEINRALKHAPSDAGAIMLGGMQCLNLGSVPIATDHEGIAKPMQANSCIAIAYKPEMMQAMLETYKKNIAMTAEEGGISPVDNVNWVVQQQLLGLPPYKDKPEYKTLAETFENASRDLSKKNFYILNPGLVRADGVDTTIGSVQEFEDDLRPGQELLAFSKDTAISIHMAIRGIRDNRLQERAAHTVTKACLSRDTPPDEVLSRIMSIANADRRINPRHPNCIAK